MLNMQDGGWKGRRKRVLKQGSTLHALASLPARRPPGWAKARERTVVPANSRSMHKSLVTGLASSRARTRPSDSTRRRSDPHSSARGDMCTLLMG
jgi:hypothetical protein